MSEPAGPARDPRREGAAVAGSKRTGERLVALLVAGVVALNFPLLSVFRGRGLIAGIPALYVYLFLVWLLLAVGTALILRRRPPSPRDRADAAEPHEP